MTGTEQPAALPPGSTIAILGGGQLGRMLALAAASLGFRCRVFAHVDDAPALHVADGQSGDFEDISAVLAFAEGADVVTYEFENVPLATAQELMPIVPVHPTPRALAVAQDRLVEKTFMRTHGIPVTRFHSIDSAEELAAELPKFDGGAILKTRRFGYDGKGQVRLGPNTDPQSAFAAIGAQPAILEALVDFECEVSALVVRGKDGDARAYDVPRNEHRDGILRRSVVPSGLAAELEDEAVAIGKRVVEALDYVGVLAVEMFVLKHAPAGGGRLMVNEIAPRVHNSGHWTMDGCLVDQFENHIRAIAGWPLGNTSRQCDLEMVNLIGDEVSQWPAISAMPNTRLHLYGKREARRGRKMGHYNRLRQPVR